MRFLNYIFSVSMNSIHTKPPAMPCAGWFNKYVEYGFASKPGDASSLPALGALPSLQPGGLRAGTEKRTTSSARRLALPAQRLLDSFVPNCLPFKSF